MFFTYHHPVQFYETDAMKIVHHSNYIRWLEEARISSLVAYNYSYQQMEAEGVSMPVQGVTCDYKRPLVFGDIARIEVEISQFTPIRLTFAYKIYNDDTNVLTTIATTSHCFVNSDTGRPLSLKKSHPQILEIFERILEENK